MAANCPHCSEEITGLQGFVTQEKLEERLERQKGKHAEAIQAIRAESSALKERLAEAVAQSQGFDSVVKERDAVKAELAQLVTRNERLAALNGYELDPGLLPSVELIYNSETAGQDEAPAFGEWLDKAKDHPLLAPHFAAKPAEAPAAEPQAPAQTAQTAQTAPAENRNPADLGAPAGLPGAKQDAAALAAYFDSREFKALPVDQQDAKLAELEALHLGA
jgi:hypothetical protein